ncbi:hypothetical protein [Bradyrhizobium sp. Mp64]|uniref:hypothetical protein n=1 Tax=Bradyrhizobium sp. Mp64 TaxID=3042158 RepID=UPI00248AF9B5|nr:hypothetical protein [Bradyrhizobium sp. Mp64]MDI2103945.1 hypothetical protein [Bradyrhizobium sp. Mp64]
MARATSNHTTKPLSSLFRDPVLRAAFKAAEDDGLSPSMVDVDQPPHLDGGTAARPELEMA